MNIKEGTDKKDREEESNANIQKERKKERNKKKDIKNALGEGIFKKE